MTTTMSDQYWMTLALSLAETAARLGEVPVGALIIKDNFVVSSAFNLKEHSNKPTAHAEILAIDRASKQLDNWRLKDCTLYVTLEPCVMCAGAVVQSRVSRVVYGTTDLKGGAFGSLYQIEKDDRLNHQPIVTAGVLQEQCATILTNFFQSRRKK